MKIIAKVLIGLILVVSLASCAQTEDSYGLLNKEEVRVDGVKYCTIVGNVLWGIILIKTIIAPVYFFGFSTMEPCPNQPKDEIDLLRQKG